MPSSPVSIRDTSTLMLFWALGSPRQHVPETGSTDANTCGNRKHDMSIIFLPTLDTKDHYLQDPIAYSRTSLSDVFELEASRGGS